MTDCKQCRYCVVNVFGDVGCKILVDWQTHQEYKKNKILNNCPLKEQK